jgi:hypothetical protein
MNKFTLIIMLLLSSITGFSQQGFESTPGPDPTSSLWTLSSGVSLNGDWAVFDNGIGTGVRWDNCVTGTAYQGTNAAYCNRENIGAGATSEDFLATPGITIPTNGQLKFWTRHYLTAPTNTIYQIRIKFTSASAQDDPSDYAIIPAGAWTDATLNTIATVYEEKSVNIPAAYIGQSVYIAFVMEFTQPGGLAASDRWLVDNVRIVQQCLAPTTLAASPSPTTSVLTWNTNGQTSFQIEHGLNGFVPTGVATSTATTGSYTQTGLISNTNYCYYVRSVCGSGNFSPWVGPYNYTSTNTNTPLPADNIYNTSGTLTNNRRVTINDYNIEFQGNGKFFFGDQYDNYYSKFSIHDKERTNYTINPPSINNVNALFEIKSNMKSVNITRNKFNISQYQNLTWMQSSINEESPSVLSINPLGGNVGIGVLNATAQLHTKGSVKLDYLGPAPVAPSYILGTDASNRVFQFPASSLFSGTDNIYNNDGILKENRTVWMDNRDLNFIDYKDINIGLYLHPNDFLEQKNDSFLNVKMNTDNFQHPNLDGFGMSKISSDLSRISFEKEYSLTQGIYYNNEKDKEIITPSSTWLQSSFKLPLRYKEEPLEGASQTLPLLINPLKGNVGIGVLNPTAQLHTIDSVRFENLQDRKEPAHLLGTNNDGDVFEYDPSQFLNNPINNTLTSNVNTITSNVNGYTSSAPIINSISNSVVGNGFITTINGISSPSIPFPAQVLEPIFVDSYLGTRLRPTDPLINGFQIKKSVNGDIGYTAINTDTTGNGSTASMGVGINTDPYSENTYISQFGLSYYIPKFRGNGALLSDTQLFIGTYGVNKSIDFITGNDFSNTFSRFNINSTDLSSLLYPNTRNNAIGTNAVTPINFLYTDSNGRFLSAPLSSIINTTPQNAWLLNGNSGTNPAINFIGTTDGAALVFRSNGGINNFSGAIYNGSTSFGYQSSDGGFHTAAFGTGALRMNTSSGQDNAAFGYYSMTENITGAQNTAFGSYALGNNVSGNFNIANGYSALSSNTTGHYNIAIGRESLVSNTIGGGNIAMGSRSLWNNIVGNGNIAIGNSTLASYNFANDGNIHNIAVGGGAGSGQISGTANGYFGSQSGSQINGTGSGNFCFGYRSGASITTGSLNSFFGHASGEYLNSGTANSLFGEESGKYLTTGSSNTLLGGLAGNNLTSGNNNIIIGYNVSAVNPLGNNQLNIGNWIRGNNGDIGIGTFPLSGIRLRTLGALQFEGLNPASENTVLTINSNGLVNTRNLNTIVNTITGNATVSAVLTGNNYQLNSPNQTMSIAGNTLSLTNNGSATTSIQLPINNTTISAGTNITVTGTNINPIINGATYTGTGIATVTPVPGQNAFTINVPAAPAETDPMAWRLAGNALPVGSISFLGTTSDNDLVFRRQNTTSGRIAIRTTSFGLNSLVNTIGLGNSAFGVQSLNINNSGTSNDAFGELCLSRNTTGNSNSAFGNISLRNNISGNSNSAFGLASLSKITTGSGNAAFGVGSLFSLLAGGSFNSIFGFNSFRNMTTGNLNVGIGFNIASNQTSGDNNIAIGSNANLLNATGSNQLNIGNWIFGNNGRIGIGAGAINPQNRLEISEGATAPAGTVGNSGLRFTNLRNINTAAINTAVNKGVLSVNALGDVILVADQVGTGGGITNACTITNFIPRTATAGNLTCSQIFDGPVTGLNPALLGIGAQGVGVNTTSPGNRLEVKHGTAGNSGLRFTNLTIATVPVANPSANKGVLSVNADGDVILVTDQGSPAAIEIDPTAWKLSGNNISSPLLNSSFVGTISDNDLIFKRNGVLSGRIGFNNTSFGLNSLLSVTTGNTNSAFGIGALRLNTTGSNNVAIGESAGTLLNGSSNILIGTNAGAFLNSGSENILIGANSQTMTFTSSAELNIGNWIFGKNGQIAIGSFINLPQAFNTNNGYQLIVRKGIRTEKVRVDIASINGWSDFVFDDSYKLMPLGELEKFIKKNNHLPNIPTAEEVVKTGIDLAQMDAKLLEKIEELTLHTIEINKKNEALEKEKNEQKALIQNLVQRLELLEQKAKQ